MHHFTNLYRLSAAQTPSTSQFSAQRPFAPQPPSLLRVTHEIYFDATNGFAGTSVIPAKLLPSPKTSVFVTSTVAFAFGTAVAMVRVRGSPQTTRAKGRQPWFLRGGSWPSS